MLIFRQSDTCTHKGITLSIFSDKTTLQPHHQVHLRTHTEAKRSCIWWPTWIVPNHHLQFQISILSVPLSPLPELFFVELFSLIFSTPSDNFAVFRVFILWKNDNWSNYMKSLLSLSLSTIRLSSWLCRTIRWSNLQKKSLLSLTQKWKNDYREKAFRLVQIVNQ